MTVFDGEIARLKLLYCMSSDEKGDYMNPVGKIFKYVVVLTGIVTIVGCSAPAPKPSQAVAPGVMLDTAFVGGMTVSELDSALQNMAVQMYQNPVNARYSDTGEVVPERFGRALDTGKTKEAVLAALPDSRVDPVCNDLEPEIAGRQLAAAGILGTHTSPILDTAAGRMVNIRLTAGLINNSVIQPGNEFSFNRSTGEPTAERGFQEAPIYADDGENAMGMGGGMCQVSSTLYNAVLAADLPVTERHAHSKPVAYVPPDRDATTFTDKDFRFLNTRRQPIILRAYVKNERLTVDIRSVPPLQNP